MPSLRVTELFSIWKVHVYTYTKHLQVMDLMILQKQNYFTAYGSSMSLYEWEVLSNNSVECEFFVTGFPVDLVTEKYNNFFKYCKKKWS